MLYILKLVFIYCIGNEIFGKFLFNLRFILFINFRKYFICFFFDNSCSRIFKFI